MVSAFGFGTSTRGTYIISQNRSYMSYCIGSPVNEKTAKLVPGPGQYEPLNPEKVRKRAPTWG